LEKITVQLKWLHQAQFAGNYVAKEKGFYKEEGLDVNLVPFSFENPTIDAVRDGKAMFGITSADELIVARAKGAPLKAFAVIYKVNPACTYSLKKSGITKPSDFIGKTVGLKAGGSGIFLYPAMMKKLGIDRGKIKEIVIGYDATELLKGLVDVSIGYIINEPQQVIAAGQDVNTILMADYGVGTYADVVFATEDTINNQPSLVEHFLRATIKGWQYAIEHNEEAVNDTLKYATTSNQTKQLYMLKQSIPLIHTGESPIGWMEKTKWEQVYNILLEQKIIDNPISIEDVYTMDLLKKITNNK
ncbi:MAG: thiamine biosynthesis protein, partial [Flavobacterium sp.]|nr:thiamine biosynthesis protein [Flavobacterium sp.]